MVRKKDVVRHPVCGLDIDFKDFKNGGEDALALDGNNFPYKPSVLVWSGHGLHLLLAIS